VVTNKTAARMLANFRASIGDLVTKSPYDSKDCAS